MESSTNGQAGELEQAVAELRENPYDLATLYNDFAVKYRVRNRGYVVLPSISGASLSETDAKRACVPSGQRQLSLLAAQASLHFSH